ADYLHQAYCSYRKGTSADVTKTVLKKYRSARYQYLLLIGKLTEHLNQIDQEARDQVEMLTEQMVKKQGVNDNLKR
ncbi:MAG: TnpV protein, partial [Anaerobutyricum hallii]